MLTVHPSAIRFNKTKRLFLSTSDCDTRTHTEATSSAVSCVSWSNLPSFILWFLTPKFQSRWVYSCTLKRGTPCLTDFSDMSRTVVHNVLVGSVSFASPGAKALHNASTAQEITVITESASSFQFKVRGNHIINFYYLYYPDLYSILTITSVFFVH